MQSEPSQPQPAVPQGPTPEAPKRDRSALDREADAARQQIAALIARTRRRAFWLATGRGLLTAAAVLLAAALVGALVSSFAPAAYARAVAGVVLLAGLAA